VQIDPLTDMYPFQNGYAYAANDPINFIDVNGLGPGPAGQIVTVAGKTTVKITAPVATVMNAVSAVSKIASPASKIALGLGLAAKSLVIGLGQSLVNNKNNDDGWKPFYKSDLITYTKSKGIRPTENNLGEELENIYEDFIKPNINWMNRSMKFRRADKVWTEGTGRNSKPDFVSDDFYDENDDCTFCPNKTKWVIEGSGYEVKQNNGKGIYLSSNNYQIKGHIDNLAAKHAGDIATGNYNPSLTLATTYDVSWSPSITSYAGIRGVQYFHRRAMFKVTNGNYQFKFVGFALSKSW
jgi:hypothetical protein